MLKFIGNGSAFNVERGNNSAYYIEGNQMLLIDCGSNIFERIIRSNLLEGIEHIHVLVTHTHADHVGSLADLILYTYYSHGEFAKPKVTVCAPKNTHIETILELNGIDLDIHCKYEVLEANRLSVIEMNDYIVQPHITSHVDEIYSYSYEIGIGRVGIYYSGDTSNIEGYYVNAINNNEYDYVFIDTCKADYEGNVHLSLRKLTELIKPEARNKVYCMHLDNGFESSEAELLGFNVTKNIFELDEPLFYFE